MVFNGEQQFLLKELKTNPVFYSILKDIHATRKRPRYKKDDKDEMKKLHELIYYSGMETQLDIVLGLLGYE